jgi:ATP-dependent DNA helicase DinG
VWSSQTETGDLSECTGLTGQDGAWAVADKVTTGPGECQGRGCPMREHCFVRSARARAQLADVIVVNHSLLFSEVGLDQPILPPYRCVIFDEAHNLADVATEAMALAVDSLSFFRITARLWRPRTDGSGSGLVASVMGEATRHLPEEGAVGRDTVHEMARGVIEAADNVVELARECFQTLARPFEAVPAYEEKILMEECTPKVGPGSETGKAADALGQGVRKLRGSVETLAESLELNEEAMPTAAELAADLRAQAANLNEVTEELQMVMAQDQPNWVYWVQRTSRRGQHYYSLHAAPLDVGRFMKSFFFDEKRCVVLTSATLQVEGGFDYIRERLGASSLGEDSLQCRAFGSPFDFQRQTMVCVPTFLPPAGGRRQKAFDEQLASLLIDLFRVTEGRALVLCTSYSLLYGLYERIKRPLEQEGIPVLAQGRDGSREALSANFRRIASSVLLGTQSFWEGVDFSGETLSCLVLTKLPFHVFTEPLVRGRVEYLRSLGLTPFSHYTLPEAVIWFRQGFGRLIRSRTDRGVIVVTDRRVVTKGYGRAFTRDLPVRCRVQQGREDLLSAVRGFFEGTDGP